MSDLSLFDTIDPYAGTADSTSSQLANMFAPTPQPGYVDVSSSQLPVLPNLPQLQKSFVNKYNEIGPQLQGIDPAILDAIQKMDLQRVSKGQSPLTKTETAKAIQAVAKNKPATAPPGPELTNVVGNSLTDLRHLLQSLPKLPIGLWNELNALPSVFSEISKNQKAGMNPLAAALKAPGIRMIPGSFVAGNVVQGPEGWKQLAEHPLFTTLDVLPFAKQLAGLTRTGQLAKAEAALNESVRPMNPIRAVMTKRPATSEYQAATGNLLMPNRFGRVTNAFMTGNAGGRLLGEMFGSDARKISSMSSGADMRLLEEMNPNAVFPKYGDPSGVIQATRAVDDIGERYGLDVNRRMTLANEMQNPATPDFFDRLPANERAFIDEYKTHLDTFARASEMEGLLGKFGGEWYDAATSTRMNRTNLLFDRRAAKLQPFIDQVAPLVNNSPRIKLLHDQLTAAANGTGTYQAAWKTYTGITRGKTRLGASSQVGATVAPAGDITLARIANLREALRGTAAAERSAADLLAKNAPARFQGMLQDRLNTALKTELINRGGDPALISQALLERNYGSIPQWDQGLRIKLGNEITREWVNLRDQGFDPIYIHSVGPGQEVSLLNPKVPLHATGLSQAKERTMYPAPRIMDPVIGLKHQGMELLRKRIATETTQNILDYFGRSEQSIRDEFAAIARTEAATKYGAARLTEPAVGNWINMRTTQYMKRNYTIYEPELGAAWSRGQITGLPTDRMWVPRTVGDTLKRMETAGLTKIPSVYDSSMKVFRTSVLALSPRWHVYNIFGGALQLMAQTNPLTVWKYLKNAREITKGGFQQLPQEIRMGMSSASRLEGALQYQAGGTFSNLLQQAVETKPGLSSTLQRMRGPAQKFGAGFNRVTEASFKFNALFDDMYRTMAYLYGYDKSLVKGMSGQVAERVGIDLAKRTMQSWDSLTPLERSVARNVVPFYSFMQHITRFVFNYPLDHPVRAAIMASFARNEIEDKQTGIPETISGMVPIGSKDSKGNQTYLSTRGINPFNDVASYFTLQGLVGSANPILGSMLTTLGVDTQSGGPNLYPNLRYDAETGRLTADTGNPLSNLVTSIIPQSRLIEELMGRNTEFNALLRTNPQAAIRMMKGQAGLPVLMQDYNIPEQQIKTELKLQEAEKAAKSEFLRTGNPDVAARYPGLQPFIERINTLRAGGQLTPYQPRQASPEFLKALQGVALNGFLP